MSRSSIIFWLPLFAGLGLAPALAQSGGTSMPGMTGMNGMMEAHRSAADQAMTAGMASMNRAMASAPMTGDADQDFVAMMIPHHQGAVSMAEVELRYGHDPFLRKLAQDIIAAQNQEIGEMRAWQKQHPAP